jgi:transcriptional regulator with XRE-family HTH domain
VNTHPPRPLYEPDTPLQQFIKELMREHRLNQSQLARRLEIAPTNVSNYLSNEPRKRIVPSAPTLDKIAQRFGADPAHLRRLANRPDSPSPGRGLAQVEESFLRSIELGDHLPGIPTGGDVHGAVNKDQTITRLATLKAAVEFAASRPDLKGGDVLRIAASWEEWVSR